MIPTSTSSSTSAPQVLAGTRQSHVQDPEFPKQRTLTSHPVAPMLNYGCLPVQRRKDNRYSARSDYQHSHAMKL